MGIGVLDGTGTVNGDLGWSVNLPYYFIDEQFAIELEQALNDEGADLAVDGVFDTATTDALYRLAAQQGITGFSIEPNYDSIELTPEVLETFWLLGFPPDNSPVTWMWAGDTSTCGSLHVRPDTRRTHARPRSAPRRCRAHRRSA